MRITRVCSYLYFKGIICSVIFALSYLSPSLAQTDVSRSELDALEAEHRDLLIQLETLEANETATAKDLDTLEKELIAAAMESQRREEQATTSELRLVSLRTRLEASRRDLVDGEDALEDLIAALALTGRHRPPALLTHPDDANAAIRAAIIMGDLTPRVQNKTDTLRDEIQRLRVLERNVLREQKRLQNSEAALKLKQHQILELTRAKRTMFENVTENATSLREEAEALGKKAETLRSLILALEATAPRAPRVKPHLQLAANERSNRPARRADSGRSDLPLPTVSQPLGVLSQPAAGRMVRRWGDKMTGGSKSEGVAYATRSGAQVASPIDGRVEYSGPFRSYGQLLILSTSDGYHVLLSGMAANYVSVGQYVRRGEAVARMTERNNFEPELYMEVRKSGTPMNPAQWMKRG